MDNLTKYIGNIQLWIIMKGKNMVIKRHFKKLITTTLVGITVLTHINKLSYAQSKNLISEKNNIPKSIAAIGSPPEARIETFPVSIWVKESV